MGHPILHSLSIPHPKLPFAVAMDIVISAVPDIPANIKKVFDHKGSLAVNNHQSLHPSRENNRNQVKTW
jgi:hypothetical protein